MLKDVVMINTGRDGYTTEQCGKTMTVGELIEALSEFDEDTEVYLKNDNGYTYGRITNGRIELEDVEYDPEDEDEDED